MGEDSKLKVEPDSMRGTGQGLAKVREAFQEGMTSAGMSLQGTGNDTSVSTGGYPEGQTCDSLLNRNGQEIMAFMQDCAISLTAIPSALFIMADLFETVDGSGACTVNGTNAAQADAMAWAFTTPGADKPSGLPPWVNGKATVQGQLKEAEEKAKGNAGGKLISTVNGTFGSFQVYALPGGGKRYVSQPRGGNYIEYGEDKHGNRTYQLERMPDGSIVTTNYANGKATGTTTRYAEASKPIEATSSDKEVRSVSDSQRVVESRDAKGNVTKTTIDHEVTTKYTDGTESHRYYTETRTPDTEGTGKITDDRTVGRQPKSATPQDYADFTKEQMQQAQAQAGVG